jgi:hypothetical protein
MKKPLGILLCLALLAFSCKKNESAVGVDVLPDSDILGAVYTELIPKVSFTKAEDSMMTTNVTNSNLLGSINDPVFGRFDASIFVNYEFSSGGLGSGLGPNPVLDSAVLSLWYNTTAAIPYIGDTTHPLSLDVFPLTQKMNRDSAYYSSRVLAYDPAYNVIEGGQSKVFTPRLYSRFLINKDDATPTPYPQLRVRLRQEFGEKLFNSSYLSSLSAFQNAFYGFLITTNKSVLPQPNYGSVFYVNMINSSIQLYYHNDNEKPAPIEIRCGANSTRYGHFAHDYQFLAEPQLAQQLAPTFDTLAAGPGQQNIYLQGAAGLRAKIEFPDLLDWRDSNIVINKAELSFTVDKSKATYFDTKLYPVPLKLFLEGSDPSNAKPTVLIENVLAFGGNYDANTGRVSFNVPHTLWQTMTGKANITGFYVSVFSPVVFPHRMVLGGWNNGSAPVKLRLWYTRLKFTK